MHILWCVSKDKFKWLPLRFYFYLSGNKNLKRIYFGEYMDKLHTILWSKGREPIEERQDLQKLSFDLIDFDHDGVITSTDFVFLSNHLDTDCSFFKKEIQPLIKHYDETHISLYGIPSDHDALRIDKYKEFLKDNSSVLVDEMRARLLAQRPGDFDGKQSHLIT